MYSIELQSFFSFLLGKEQELLSELCGERYSREEREVKRIKTCSRVIFTKFGEIRKHFVYVKDVTGRIFSPLLDFLKIEKYQHMSKDLKNQLRDKACKMTYRDSKEDVLNSFGLNISAMTIWKINQQQNGFKIVKPSKKHKILLADGTKIKHNKGGHLEPRAVMSIDQEKKEKSLLFLGVEESWQEIAEKLDFNQFLVLVGDGETGLKENLVKSRMSFQFCHLHAIRDLSLFLWYDKVEKNARNEFLKPFKQILYTIQNSTKKYFSDKDKNRLHRRLRWAQEQTEILVKKTQEKELTQSAGFLERNKNYFFTATILALKEDLVVPFTTNQTERLMKEIGKRTKKKSMAWSPKGLFVILQAVIKRYFLQPEKRNYKNIYGGNTTGSG